jgi:hypothetical protein
MGSFTFVAAWEFLDFVTLLLGLITVLFIVRREKHPGSILLEMTCFVVLYAAVYENFATVMGWYGYGRVLFRIGNVPLSVPVVEYLVVYAALRMADHMRMPTWVKPFVAGLSGMLLDFSIDPIAIKLLRVTREGTISRWSWFPGPSDVQIYGEPVYNFSGWMLLCGYAAALLLLGRWWFRRSGHKPWVGFAYPPLAMLASLGLIVSPLSKFLLWAEPLASKGGIGEWIMLGIHLLVPTILLAALWRGRMQRRFTVRENLPVFLVVGVTHAANIVVTMITGTWQVLWLVVLAALLHGLLLFLAARPGAPVPGA